MTLAELRMVDIEAMWDGLTAEHHAAIGAAALAWELARRTAEDDGSIEGDAVRRGAAAIAEAAQSDLAAAVETAFPGIARRAR